MPWPDLDHWDPEDQPVEDDVIVDQANAVADTDQLDNPEKVYGKYISLHIVTYRYIS